MIDLQPDEDQQLIVETVRDFSRSEIRPLAREADEAGEPPPDLLARAHELGLVSATLPESFGGSGVRSAVTQVLVAEELAWGDLALAIAILSPALLAHPVADWGTDAQRATYLPALAETRFVPGALALAEPRFDSDAFRTRLSARREGDAYVLDGAKCLVPWLEDLRVVLVSAADDDGPQLFFVDVDAPGLGATRAGYMGLRALPLAELRLQAVRVPVEARLGGPGGADLAQVVQRGRVSLGALAVGLSRAAFELARDYAKQRETFGAPIASRQSIAFMLADMATEIDALRLLVWEAAWRLDQQLDVTSQSALVAQQAQRVVLQAADGAVQIYGGHGYVREYLPELLLRNAGGFGSFGALSLV